MIAVVLKIYDYFKTNHKSFLFSLLIITVGLLFLLSKQSYKEDILDFLPLGNDYHKAMPIYQDLSGADKVFVVFESKDSTINDIDKIVEAIDEFERTLINNDNEGLVKNLISQIDYNAIGETTDYLYKNIPYLLTEVDYARIDSLFSSDLYVADCLRDDKQLLLFPASSIMTGNVSKDPLKLFSPVLNRFQSATLNVDYELYDGYIFSPDMSKGIVMMTSPFGASETENNARLINFIDKTIDNAKSVHEDVDIHIIGGPVVAVGNATQIRNDSLLSISMAVILILLLLFLCFRSIWNISLIIISIVWGWLFAMGTLSLVHNGISIIVIGISSAILGIAVNYPLHFISHLSHTPDARKTLKEIVTPLLVGNITTVGAFMALVPLKAQALRDLGLFSSLLLIGTILFVLLFLPQLSYNNGRRTSLQILDVIGEYSIENKRSIMYLVIGLTVLFGFYSLNTSFDADMSHINYMSASLQQEMKQLQDMMPSSGENQTVYIVYEGQTADEALAKSERSSQVIQTLVHSDDIDEYNSCTQVFSSLEEQKRKIERWNAFVNKYKDKLTIELREEAEKEGFSSESFQDFEKIINFSYTPQDISVLEKEQPSLYSNYVFQNDSLNQYYVVDQLLVKGSEMQNIVAQLKEKAVGDLVFDVSSMNSSIATNLANDFNYIGWACGLIVFFFLWFTLGSIELALLSFVPMAISWVWILGIMSILGIQFNMVNVILATFIFGQGDDYTIFMTEGCQYEYAYRKKMIASYKKSIVISALIMFIGIGSLIFAKHPALYSLGEITIIGMFSVVLMAYLIPPFLFKWLTLTANGEYRMRPLSFYSLMRIIDKDADKNVDLVIDRYRYKGSELFSTVKKRLKIYDGYKKWLNSNSSTHVIIINNGYGEFSLLMALTYPDKVIYAFEEDEDCRLVSYYSAEGVVNNLHVLPKDKNAIVELYHNLHDDVTVYLVNASEPDNESFGQIKKYVI